MKKTTLFALALLLIGLPALASDKQIRTKTIIKANDFAPIFIVFTKNSFFDGYFLKELKCNILS